MMLTLIPIILIMMIMIVFVVKIENGDDDDGSDLMTPVVAAMMMTIMMMRMKMISFIQVVEGSVAQKQGGILPNDQVIEVAYIIITNVSSPASSLPTSSSST